MLQLTSPSNALTTLMDCKKVYRLEAFDGEYLASRFKGLYHLWFKSNYGVIRTIAKDLPTLEDALKAYKEHYLPRLGAYISKLQEELQ